MPLHHLCFLGALTAFLPATLASVGRCNSYGLDFAPTKTLKVVHEWGYLYFEYPDSKSRDEALRDGSYVLKNITAYEANEYKGITFMTTPRIKFGVPATLSTLSDKKLHGQPLLKPFPNWETNRLGNCDGLTSVFITHIDKHGRLWTLDSGVVDTYESVPIRVCQPKIVILDLNDNGKLLGAYHIPDEVLDCNSYLVGFQVDIRDSHKDDVFIYIADTYAYKMIVFDFYRKSFHRSFQSSFISDPKYVDVNILGSRVYWDLGILSVTLGPLCDGDRRVYYHPLSSVEECYVMASTLRNPAYKTNELAFPDSYYCFSKKRQSLSATETSTDDGIVFFFQEQLAALFCWNTITDPKMLHTAIVAQNETTMQTIEVLRLAGGEILGVSSQLQHFLGGYLSGRRTVNIRLLKANVNDLIRGTSCDPNACAQEGCKSHYKESADL